MQARLIALALATLALPFVPSAAHAAESYDNCTGFIDSIPAVITTQGTWCLRHDLTTRLSNVIGIQIQANNVTLDCNHFKVGGLAAGLDTQSVGIAGGELQNVTVRNCNVRGFYIGISLMGWPENGGGGVTGGGHLIEHNRFVGNTSMGILAGGDGTIVQHNVVLDTGGTRAVLEPSIMGIQTFGSVDLLDNTVSGVTGGYSDTGWVVGILQSGRGHSSIRNNRVRNVVPSAAAKVLAVFADSASAIIRDNDLQGRGTTFDIAIECTVPNASVFRGNTIADFQVTAQGCHDGGDNVTLMEP